MSGFPHCFKKWPMLHCGITGDLNPHGEKFGQGEVGTGGSRSQQFRFLFFMGYSQIRFQACAATTSRQIPVKWPVLLWAYLEAKLKAAISDSHGFPALTNSPPSLSSSYLFCISKMKYDFILETNSAFQKRWKLYMFL